MSTRSITSPAGALFLMAVLAMAQSLYAQQRQSAPLPAGPGKELVESVCAACHPTDQITRSAGYTPEGWRELILTMLDLSASPNFETIA